MLTTKEATRDKKPLHNLLPRDYHDFKHWEEGSPVTTNHCRVMFRHLGENSDRGKMALIMFKAGLKRHGAGNMNTYADIVGYGDLREAVLKANERNNGKPIFSEEDAHLLEVRDDKFTIACLSRESIRELVANQN